MGRAWAAEALESAPFLQPRFRLVGYPIGGLRLALKLTDLFNRPIRPVDLDNPTLTVTKYRAEHWLCGRHAVEVVPDALFFDLYCVFHSASHVVKRQAVACSKAAHKSGTYRSLRYLGLAALVPSAGTISHKLSCVPTRVLSAPVCVSPHAAYGARPPHRNAKAIDTRLPKGIKD